MKIITVIGARPQFIKAAVVSRAFESSGIQESILHTGQHFDSNMSEIFFEELGIPKPSINLGIGGGTHGQNTGRMIEEIEKTLIKEKPDWLLVYGDTDSTLAGALAAAKLHIPVAHVEAGLRSFNRRMPEEINRILTDHIASLLFAPTSQAIEHLAEEGVSGDKVIDTGDVMFDAVLFYGKEAEARSQVLDKFSLKPKSYVLATIHRAENTDDPARLKAIIAGMASSEKQVVLPLHPRTRAKIDAHKLQLSDNILVVDPVGYLDMVMLEKNASLIVTDSGGVQKEAFFHRVQCVTLRDETEWVELIDADWNRLVKPLTESKVAQAINSSYQSGRDIKPYGEGKAVAKIVDRLLSAQ